MRLDKITMALLLMISVTACATNGSEDEEVRKTAEANAKSEWKPSTEGELQLAVEVEVRADGVTPLGASVVRASGKTNSAIQDLRVVANGASRQLGQYVMPDPRFAKVDREGEQILPSARTFVFAPLSADLTTITVQPVPGGKENVSRGGNIDARPLLREACEKERELSVCQQILRAER